MIVIDGIYQLASFHPDYCFADADPDDPANYTNRSPCPTLHLLREASLEQALRHVENPEEIPERNIRVARELGAEQLRDMLNSYIVPTLIFELTMVKTMSQTANQTTHQAKKSLTGKLLSDCSPYIFNLVYDIDVRMLFIECIDEPESGEPDLRMVFPGVLSYQEKNLQGKPDDETMDDVVSIEQTQQGCIVITTYKKEITLQVAGEPFVEEIE